MPQSVRKHALLGAATVALLCSGSALAEAPTGGQMKPPPEDSVLTGVTVSVPRTIHRERYGMVSQVVNMSVRVPYGDLDLQTPSGVAELDKRITEAGNYVCRQLEVMYQIGLPDAYGCVKEAIGGAQPQVVLARAQR
jgi:UrcA family protein